MTPRERTLAVILVAGIVAAAGGFVGYQFVYSPLQAKSGEAAQLEQETRDLGAKLKQFQKDAKRLAEAKRRSLPADPSVAAREYYAAIQQLLVDAKVAAGFVISPSSADNRTTPVLAGKTPAYTKVILNVEFKKADMWQVHDFLTGYYKLNLLHQITALNIKTDDDTGGAARKAGGRNDLTVTLTTEGIILDGAEPRQTLVTVPLGFAAVGGFAGHSAVSLTPEAGRGINPIQFVPVLATKPRDYTWIVFKDIFHGPYPKPEPLGISKIDEVAAKVGEKIPPVKVAYTADDVINGKVTLSARSDSPLFPPGSIKIDPARGTLTLTPAGDEPGRATVVVTATDAKGKKVDRSFAVSVTVPTDAKTDISQSILLTNVTPRSDGTASAMIRDGANNFRYIIDATGAGAKVEKFWFAGANNRKRDRDYEDRNLLILSDDWSATSRRFRIVAVDYDGLIVAEKGPPPKPADPRAKGPRKADPPPRALAAAVGGAAAAVPPGPQQLYRWAAGKSLKALAPVPADEAQRILQKFAESGPLGAAAVASTRDE